MATNTTAHTETPGAKEPFPPFQTDTFASQLLWFGLIFAGLYLLMSRIALPRVGGIIAARSGQIEGDLADAQRLKGETEAAMAAYDKVLADARGNAQSIGAKTRDELMAQADQRRKTLEDQLNRKLEEAEKIIAGTKESAMTNVKGIAVDAAAAIVERLIGQAPSDKAVSDAVTAVLKR